MESFSFTPLKSASCVFASYTEVGDPRTLERCIFRLKGNAANYPKPVDSQQVSVGQFICCCFCYSCKSRLPLAFERVETVLPHLDKFATRLFTVMKRNLRPISAKGQCLLTGRYKNDHTVVSCEWGKSPSQSLDIPASSLLERFILRRNSII